MCIITSPFPEKEAINKHLLELIATKTKGEIMLNAKQFDVDCTIKGVGDLQLIPRNLYSFMLMMGIVFPYYMVHGKAYMDVGGVRYSMRNGEPTSKQL